MKAAKLLHQQKQYFRSGATRSLEFRVHQLETLRKLLNQHEDDLMQAVYDDFRKPAFEAFATELGLVHTEIAYTLKNLKKWMKPEKVSGSLVNFPSRNYILSEPYGSVLVISPWNYPLQLALTPVVGAIAAGNTVVLKPSEISANTSAALKKVIGKWFKEDFIAVVEGGVETSQDLLATDFDYIFFTGSPRVGKIVMKAASKNLTPVTLELGGKSPCIVDGTSDLKTSAKRIAWGKFVNAGQTCVAPDYLLVQEDIKEDFMQLLKDSLLNLYDVNPRLSPDYSRIINRSHYDRLTSYLSDGKIVTGGNTDDSELYIEPTILENVGWDDAVMQEEIFGPVLPVLSFKTIDQAIDTVNNRPKPLALYLFTSDSKTEKRVLTECSFGGGAVNDVIAHLGNHHLPLGGVGNSGMGSYHGKKSFDTFSHKKSIMKKPFWIDIPTRYAPYKKKIKWLKRIMK